MTSVTCRHLRLRDARFCWRLARDPVVRQASVSQDPPSIVQHARWMLRWANGRLVGERMAWVILARSGGLWHRAGLLRVSWHGFHPEIHIAVAKTWRGRGVGRTVLSDWTPLVAFHWGASVLARIRPENEASIRAFRRAGYEYIGMDGPLSLYAYHAPAEVAA